MYDYEIMPLWDQIIIPFIFIHDEIEKHDKRSISDRAKSSILYVNVFLREFADYLRGHIPLFDSKKRIEDDKKDSTESTQMIAFVLYGVTGYFDPINEIFSELTHSMHI